MSRAHPSQPAWMPVLRTRHLQPHQLLQVGQPVHVNHRAYWLPAIVTAIGARQVRVRYQNSGLAETVMAWAIRAAAGVGLRAAQQTTAGDRVIFAHTVRTMAAPPMAGRGGWLVLHFTDGHRPAQVLPGEVLRLAETPASAARRPRPARPAPGLPADGIAGLAGVHP